MLAFTPPCNPGREPACDQVRRRRAVIDPSNCRFLLERARAQRRPRARVTRGRTGIFFPRMMQLGDDDDTDGYDDDSTERAVVHICHLADGKLDTDAAPRGPTDG